MGTATNFKSLSCDLNCSGNFSEICGGYLTNSIYSTVNCTLSTTSNISTKPTTTVTSSSMSKILCYYNEIQIFFGKISSKLR